MTSSEAAYPLRHTGQQSPSSSLTSEAATSSTTSSPSPPSPPSPRTVIVELKRGLKASAPAPPAAASLASAPLAAPLAAPALVAVASPAAPPPAAAASARCGTTAAVPSSRSSSSTASAAEGEHLPEVPLETVELDERTVELDDERPLAVSAHAVRGRRSICACVRPRRAACVVTLAWRASRAAISAPPGWLLGWPRPNLPRERRRRKTHTLAQTW
eukprot:scaffold60060_cov53-Phaeocystis_antarctica.AAC.2